MRQVLQAVEHMHRQGLVHRDIKLENMVYESSDRDRVKLIAAIPDVVVRCQPTPRTARCRLGGTRMRRTGSESLPCSTFCSEVPE